MPYVYGGLPSGHIGLLHPATPGSNKQSVLEPRPPVIQLTADARAPHLSLSDLLTEALHPAADDLRQGMRQNLVPQLQQLPQRVAALAVPAAGMPQNSQQLLQRARDAASDIGAAAPAATLQRAQKRPRSGSRKALRAIIPVRNERPKRVRRMVVLADIH